MSQRLPVHINPEHACNLCLKISGSLKLENMERLRDELIAPFGEVDVDLEFFKEDRLNKLSGSITGEMVVICQRCMQTMTIKVDHTFKLGFIRSDEEADLLLPDEEPCLIGDEDLLLSEIIEDELELLLPMIAMHDDVNCSNFSEKLINEDARETKIDQKKNPFAVLAELKNR